jgi:hypothetical protein
VELKDEKRRERIERLLGGRLQEKIEPRDESGAVPSDWVNDPAAQVIFDLWTKLPHIRNDVDHAGMKTEDKSASALIKIFARWCLRRWGRRARASARDA